MIFGIFAALMAALLPWLIMWSAHLDAAICGRPVRKEKFKAYILTSVVGAIVSVVLIMEHKAQIKVAAEREHAEWVRNGCLVYDTECGSKHKYACQKKTNIKERVMIEDTLIKTYPTCSP